MLVNENILASTNSRTGAQLFATNKRVISYKKGLLGEKVDCVNYPHVIGSVYEQQSFLGLIVLGIVLIIVAYFLISNSSIIFIGGLLNIFGIILALVGILIIPMAIFYRPSWYQIQVSGMNKDDRAKWRTASTNEAAKSFSRCIQEQIGLREKVPIKEKEIITKEIVMVSCDYCGGLMPQKSTFCPNCGARRKE